MSVGDESDFVFSSTVKRESDPEEETPSPSRDLREFALWAACCCFLIVMVPIVLFIIFYQSSLPICSSWQCVEYSRLFSSSINPSMNPCVNFYQFVCDGWDKKHDRSVKRRHFDSFVHDVANELGEIVAPGVHQTAIEKSAKFYQSCLQVLLQQRNEDAAFKELLKNGNVTWPQIEEDGDLLEVMTYAEVHWNAHPFFVFRKDVGTDGSFIIHVMPGSMTSIWHDERLKLKQRNQYYVYYNRAHLIMTGNEPNATEFRDHVAIEDKILDKLIAALKLGGDDILTEEEFKRHSTAFHYNRWRTAFKELLDIPTNENISIAISSVSYFDAFNEITSEVGEPTMIMMIGWHVIFILGHLTLSGLGTSLYHNLREAEEIAHTKCVLHVERYMGLAVSAPYVVKVIPPDVYYNAGNLTQMIAERTLRRLAKHHGLNFNYTGHRQDRSGMFQRFDKLANLSELDQVFSTFPDMQTLFCINHVNAVRAWRKRREEESAYFGQYLRVRDYYDVYRTEDDDFVISPLALTHPLFAAETTYALQYGALGQLVAGAIAKHIMKNVPQPQSEAWTAAVTRFTRCFNGTSFSKESIFYRMVSGRVLWEAFNRAAGSTMKKEVESKHVIVLRTKTKEARIQGFSKYNPDQLFFIVMCYIQCGHSRREYQEYCNGVVRNLEEFSHAFNCTKDSPMNPTQKCAVF
ncbi:membrane metallo-endopeptidase-like 1 [Ornithodoros turicata]|uniref:membrane metallo-endopeptidase-like 1 n=1 Tax=Ornithodoros turicata TaxID=34597 RepID=UPI00313A229E